MILHFELNGPGCSFYVCVLSKRNGKGTVEEKASILLRSLNGGTKKTGTVSVSRLLQLARELECAAQRKPLAAAAAVGLARQELHSTSSPFPRPASASASASASAPSCTLACCSSDRLSSFSRTSTSGSGLRLPGLQGG
jgi:hypothetical protein